LQEELHESVFCHHYTIYNIQFEACNKQTILTQQFVQGFGGETRGKETNVEIQA